MHLILWRHADAVEGSPDTERRLSGKGLRQAALAAGWLNPRLPENATILVSPAIRARQTANTLGRQYSIHDSLAISSTAENMLEAARRASSSPAVLLVSHQPLLGNLASLLLCGQKQPWHIAKSQVWWFEIQENGARETVLRAVMDPSLISSPVR
ncbi:MAG: histidine phosphatase family protein [Alistipes senegalensis]|nr:histidine phosphatase family protein [Oxalobacter formigenes]MCM1280848.1 histidine phosphatase family protein [Alistipes senegalensis]